MTAINVTIAQLRPVLRALRLGEPDAITPLQGGSTAVFRVDRADGEPLILKTYPDDRPWTPQKDAYAASLLRDLAVPVTQYLAIDQTQDLLPFRFAITNYLPGVPAASLKDDPGIGDVYRQMGALIRALHSVRMPAYGYLGPAGLLEPASDHAAYVGAMADHAFAHFCKVGGDAELARRLRAIFDARFDAVVRHGSGPVFAHDDVHPGNVLVERGGDGRLRISGLIDFGNARASDAACDLAKCIFCTVHQAPEAGALMREGYGPVDHPDPEGALWFYTLLHRMIMWWWLRHIGVIPAGEPHDLIDRLREMAGT
ncbi:MAG: aminoglycoside phosphotransferase family protein [Alphaproteobacteria bacterium]|nr:aminoglycoside phosphotransferase family protein [Alphaproteobacteria bacterium]